MPQFPTTAHAHVNLDDHEGSVMTKSFKTEQEDFWAGEFGTAYIERNQDAQMLASNLKLFAKALDQADSISSCLEFGANIGMNLRALKLLYPHARLRALAITPDAANQLCEFIGKENVFNGSILDFQPQQEVELSLIKGVLIHINPEVLPEVYDRLYQASKRYILVCEYYSRTPTAISYRGHDDRLFKRDFAGEMLDRFPDLYLVDYGFAYIRDRAFPKDDLNWFLLEKR